MQETRKKNSVCKNKLKSAYSYKVKAFYKSNRVFNIFVIKSTPADRISGRRVWAFLWRMFRHDPYCHCKRLCDGHSILSLRTTLCLLKAVAISFSIMTMGFPRQGVCTPFLGMTARSAAIHIVIADNFVTDTPYCHCEALLKAVAISVKSPSSG